MEPAQKPHGGINGTTAGGAIGLNGAGDHAKRESAPLRKVVNSLHQLYSASEGEQFPTTMMAVAEELVPCVSISFDSVDLKTGRATNQFDRPIAWQPEEFVARWQTFCHQHPGIDYLKKGGSRTVFSFDDFLTEREFRRTAFYNDFFHPIGGTHQIGVILPVPGFVVGVALNRDRPFSPRERELVELLQPHFATAFYHSQIFTALKGSAVLDYRPWRNRGLTHRECEVLRWVIEGKRNGEIAVILQMSIRTVGKHLENIFQKLGVETRSAAAAEARDIIGQHLGMPGRHNS